MSGLLRVTAPHRHAGLILCSDHLRQVVGLSIVDFTAEELDAAQAAFLGQRCLMCGVHPAPDRRCANVECDRSLHPEWPAVYCCNDCALEDR